jgi:hypothetical protein
MRDHVEDVPVLRVAESRLPVFLQLLEPLELEPVEERLRRSRARRTSSPSRPPSRPRSPKRCPLNRAPGASDARMRDQKASKNSGGQNGRAKLEFTSARLGPLGLLEPRDRRHEPLALVPDARAQPCDRLGSPSMRPRASHGAGAPPCRARRRTRGRPPVPACRTGRARRAACRAEADRRPRRRNAPQSGGSTSVTRPPPRRPSAPRRTSRA